MVGVFVVISALVVVVGIPVILFVWSGEANQTEEEKKKKEKEEEEKKKELVQSYLDWWLNSKFNEFEVVKKYTAMLSKEDRYRAVIRQVCTDTYEDESLSVTEYYRWKEGTFLNYSEAPIKYCLQRDVIEEFNKATDNKLTYGLVYRYFFSSDFDSFEF